MQPILVTITQFLITLDEEQQALSLSIVAYDGHDKHRFLLWQSSNCFNVSKQQALDALISMGNLLKESFHNLAGVSTNESMVGKQLYIESDNFLITNFRSLHDTTDWFNIAFSFKQVFSPQLV